MTFEKGVGGMRKMAKIFKALGNERRLTILKILSRRRFLSVNQIADGLRLSVRSTSKHLLILEAVGLVSRRQRRSKVFYSLPDLKKKVLVSALLRLLKKEF